MNCVGVKYSRQKKQNHVLEIKSEYNVLEGGYRQRSTKRKNKPKVAERSNQIVNAVHYCQPSLGKVQTAEKISWWHNMK